MLEINTHPGIGDVSWIYSKLVNCEQPLKLKIAEDKKTKRALPFVGLLPQIQAAEYGDLGDYLPLSKCGNAYFAEYLEAQKLGLDLYVSANNYLETGARLEGYMPDLPTSFHYEIITKETDHEQAQRLLPKGHVYFGIYTSSQQGAVNWNGWQQEEWMDFAKRLYRQFPEITLVILGAKWDMDLSCAVSSGLHAAGIPHVNLVGKTDMGSAVEVLKRLTYFVGYASGMGILGNVLQKPGLMLYPNHLEKLMHAWPCPISLGLNRHIGMLWERPVKVLARCKPILKELF